MDMTPIQQFIRRRPKTSFAVLVAMLCLIAVGASWVIDTDREKITRAIEETRTGLESKDVEAALRYVPEDFRQGNLTREDLRGYIEEMFQSYGAPNVLTTTWHEMSVADGSATCEISFYVDFRRISRTGGRFLTSRWRLTLTAGQNDWYFQKIEPLRVNRRKVKSLRELVERARSYQ